MRLGRACELIDLARSVGQQVGNAEPGHDVDRLRDPIAPDEREKPLSRFVHALSLSAGLRTSGKSKTTNAIENRIPSADKTDGSPQPSMP